MDVLVDFLEKQGLKMDALQVSVTTQETSFNLFNIKFEDIEVTQNGLLFNSSYGDYWFEYEVCFDKDMDLKINKISDDLLECITKNTKVTIGLE